MVNKYFKAIVLTAILMAAGFAAIGVYDESRYRAIASKLDSDSLQTQAAAQLLFYGSVYGESKEVCAAIEQSAQLQAKKNAGLLSELERAKSQGLSPDVELAKRKFIVQNLQLFLLLEKAKADCGQSTTVPVLYFYPDKYYCEDCAVQAAALDTVVKECSKVRVFALPTDLEIPVIGLLVQKYSIGKYPSLVIDGKMHKGIVAPQQLRELTGCSAQG